MKTKIRLNPKEIKAIKETIKAFDKNAKILLFGSRTDPNKKGGDIDLLVISKEIDLSKKLKIKAKLFKLLGDRKIDIIITKDPYENPFTQMAYEEGINI